MTGKASGNRPKRVPPSLESLSRRESYATMKMESRSSVTGIKEVLLSPTDDRNGEDIPGNSGVKRQESRNVKDSHSDIHLAQQEGDVPENGNGRKSAGVVSDNENDIEELFEIPNMVGEWVYRKSVRKRFRKFGASVGRGEIDFYTQSSAPNFRVPRLPSLNSKAIFEGWVAQLLPGINLYLIYKRQQGLQAMAHKILHSGRFLSTDGRKQKDEINITHPVDIINRTQKWLAQLRNFCIVELVFLVPLYLLAIILTTQSQGIISNGEMAVPIILFVISAYGESVALEQILSGVERFQVTDLKSLRDRFADKVARTKIHNFWNTMGAIRRFENISTNRFLRVACHQLEKQEDYISDEEFEAWQLYQNDEAVFCSGRVIFNPTDIQDKISEQRFDTGCLFNQLLFRSCLRYKSFSPWFTINGIYYTCLFITAVCAAMSPTAIINGWGGLENTSYYIEQTERWETIHDEGTKLLSGIFRLLFIIQVFCSVIRIGEFLKQCFLGLAFNLESLRVRKQLFSMEINSMHSLGIPWLPKEWNSHRIRMALRACTMLQMVVQRETESISATLLFCGGGSLLFALYLVISIVVESILIVPWILCSVFLLLFVLLVLVGLLLVGARSNYELAQLPSRLSRMEMELLAESMSTEYTENKSTPSNHAFSTSFRDEGHGDDISHRVEHEKSRLKKDVTKMMRLLRAFKDSIDINSDSTRILGVRMTFSLIPTFISAFITLGTFVISRYNQGIVHSRRMPICHIQESKIHMKNPKERREYWPC